VRRTSNSAAGAGGRGQAWLQPGADLHRRHCDRKRRGATSAEYCRPRDRFRHRAGAYPRLSFTAATDEERERCRPASIVRSPLPKRNGCHRIRGRTCPERCCGSVVEARRVTRAGRRALSGTLTASLRVPRPQSLGSSAWPRADAAVSTEQRSGPRRRPRRLKECCCGPTRLSLLARWSGVRVA
jgi:hypothetical protein